MAEAIKRIQVRMLRTGMYRSVCYNAGELVSFPADLARNLCRKKYAEAVTSKPERVRREPANKLA